MAIPLEAMGSFDPADNAPNRGASAGLRELFADHYWDSFQEEKELIMKHIDSVLALHKAEHETVTCSWCHGNLLVTQPRGKTK